MDIKTLTHTVDQCAALRRRQTLQPVGGKGDKIFPPTYPPSEGMKRVYGQKNAPPQHIFERRQLNGREAWCVLADSVQSQANRLEEALLAAVRDGAIQLPYVTVDFSEQAGRRRRDHLARRAASRLDAILRDSLFDGKPFMKSRLGLASPKPSPRRAALLETSPTALLFGAWHSTGEGGGIGAKFPRCLVSEIVAVDTPVDEAWRTAPEKWSLVLRPPHGSRLDPLWRPAQGRGVQGCERLGREPAPAGNKAKKIRPSEINHGNIAPTVQPLGITCEYAEHMRSSASLDCGGWVSAAASGTKPGAHCSRH